MLNTGDGREVIFRRMRTRTGRGDGPGRGDRIRVRRTRRGCPSTYDAPQEQNNGRPDGKNTLKGNQSMRGYVISNVSWPTSIRMHRVLNIGGGTGHQGPYGDSKLRKYWHQCFQRRFL